MPVLIIAFLPSGWRSTARSIFADLSQYHGIAGFCPRPILLIKPQVHVQRALAIIGGDPKRFRPYVDLYHRAFAEFGRSAKEIAVHSPGYVAATDEAAREEYWPAYKGMHDRIGGERGWPPIGRTEFDREVERGALHLGAPDTVARKIAATAKALGIVRFDLKYSAGTLAHDKLMRCIELYGSKVIPLVRDMLA